MIPGKINRNPLLNTISGIQYPDDDISPNRHFQNPISCRIPNPENLGKPTKPQSIIPSKQ